MGIFSSSVHSLTSGPLALTSSVRLKSSGTPRVSQLEELKMPMVRVVQ